MRPMLQQKANAAFGRRGALGWLRAARQASQAQPSNSSPASNVSVASALLGSASSLLSARGTAQLRGPSRVLAAVAEAPTAADAPTAESKMKQSIFLELKTSDESDKLLRIRHSCAHIMAMAVQRLYKNVQVTVGPWTDRGFFYDFVWPADSPITEKDLKKIKKEMAKIMKADLPFVREEVSPSEAESRIRAANEPYKLEILQSILQRDPNAPITIYHIGEPAAAAAPAAAPAAEGEAAEAAKAPKGLRPWWDLCAGPHVERTGDINPDAVELESTAGAYWRGDENNAQLTRVYGTAWESPEQLAAYKQLKEEAAKRDHRKLGAELNLFSIQESSGGGLVYWHPPGAMVRHLIETFWKELHLNRGYQLVYSPHIAKADLWKTSGHLDFYRENMYEQMQVEDETYQLRPMNCPFHISVYKDGYYSYRDLPLRLAELGTVYRYERSGTMHGLFRVRGFTQDDAHIFCLPNQITSEIKGVLDLVEEILGTFGFNDYEVNLSTRPEKSVGDDAIWHTAESALVEALGEKGWAYQVDAGGGAFYGPKIDIKIRDAIGRKWQCSTIQLDFNLPERFDVVYHDASASKQRPIMIHRAIFGSLERFFGILIENYMGAFPLWLAPVQVRLLTVNDNVVPYAQEVAAAMRKAGVRVAVEGQASIAKLIRNAEKAKTPVICVVGAKEAEAGTLSVRLYGGQELGSLPSQDVIGRIAAATATKGKF
ncbi:hypothetical protein HYH03_014734 [Edaphochlamys debaryana]|uniref:threonine--tRNA ligase n=1 Tax=Edaphochlamys debaryana TaxID=47281 RepID=A0A836BT74_9CHLO|nr:hypothetical protein HYH03_014734 [Edaphochlamys debaryana]|eukprot:KAG2486564.1 hypothetical protein HYH03_014734 [Edaphochlamys debaryana]